MPAFQVHYRLAFGGSLYTNEEWSSRLNITSAGTLPDATAADGMLPDLVTALSTWMADAESMLSTAANLSWVKFNHISASGKYTDPSNSRVAEVTPVVDGVGTPLHPPQVAVVVSLRTAHTRGKAHAGRLFTPALAANCSSGLITPTGQGFMAGTATTLLNAINAVVTPAGVSIISATGESNHVTRVAVGSVFDTMRTRRASLAEKPYELGAVLA